MVETKSLRAWQTTSDFFGSSKLYIWFVKTFHLIKNRTKAFVLKGFISFLDTKRRAGNVLVSGRTWKSARSMSPVWVYPVNNRRENPVNTYCGHSNV